MPSSKRRIGFLPRSNTYDLINNIASEENLSASKIVGILVEEALIARGVLNKDASQAIRIINNDLDLDELAKQNLKKETLNDMNELVSDNGVTYEKRKSNGKHNTVQALYEEEIKKEDLIDNELIEKFRLFQEFKNMAKKGLI